MDHGVYSTAVSPTGWNCLTTGIVNCHSLYRFKSKFKTQYFQLTLRPSNCTSAIVHQHLRNHCEIRALFKL